VLLIGAGLLIKSFVHVLTADKGFDAEQVLTANLSLSSVKYPEPQQQDASSNNSLNASRRCGCRGRSHHQQCAIVGGEWTADQIEGRTDPPIATHR